MASSSSDIRARMLGPLALVGAAALAACEKPAPPRPTVPDASAPRASAAPPRVVALEVARVVDGQGRSDWLGPIFRLHVVADGEAWVSRGLRLGRVGRDHVEFRPGDSRGLPIQTDPCVAPAIDEVRREAGGRLVATLMDLGHPHYTGGCNDGVPTDMAYAWQGDRWTPTAPPAWGRTVKRAVYTEATIAGKVVRLVGPRAAPTEDGYSPPSAFEHLGRCFGPERPRFAGWDPPTGLVELPPDLCVEGVAFAARADDALLFGRTKDSAAWLERRAPGAPPRRARLPLPAGCKGLRSSGARVKMPRSVDEGELEIAVSCDDREEVVLVFRWRGGDAKVEAVGQRALDVDDRVDPSLTSLDGRGGFRVVEAPAPPDAGRPRVRRELHHGEERLLPDVTQLAVLGDGFAVAERAGHLFLVSRAATPTPIVDVPDSAPEGALLSLPTPPGSGGCGPDTFFAIARVPAAAGADAGDGRDAARAAAAGLAAEVPPLREGPEPFVEIRVGDTWYVGRHWAAAFDARFDRAGKAAALERRALDAARARRLEPALLCLPDYPEGAGRTFRVDASGRAEPVDAEVARRVRPEPP